MTTAQHPSAGLRVPPFAGAAHGRPHERHPCSNPYPTTTFNRALTLTLTLTQTLIPTHTGSRGRARPPLLGPLKVILMSATLDASSFSDYFGGCPGGLLWFWFTRAARAIVCHGCRYPGPAGEGEGKGRGRGGESLQDTLREL